MTQLARHTLIETLHTGTDRELLRGYSEGDRIPILIKLPRIGRLPAWELLARLQLESSLLNELDLPGVPKVYGLEKSPGSLALLLRDPGGQLLSSLLRSGPMEVGTVLRIAIALTDILRALHQQRIIHKDIKPQSILFDPVTDAVHLLDFGIATRLSQESLQPMSPGALEGTLAYMAPEQTGRMNRSVDHRADFYSLGATLYELLTGAPPFTADDPIEMMHSHIARVPVPPNERTPAVPVGVSAVVMKLLAKTAEERYQTAAGLKIDLQECLQQWQSSRQVADFPLGRSDRAGELRIPQKLYGRSAELKILMEAFEHARAGAAELLLVSGYSGIGKSALVSEIHKSIAHSGGYFVAGKFDLLNRSTPYASLAQALRDLVRQVLSEHSEQVSAWRQRLQSAVGSSGQILVDLVPELGLLIGAQRPVDALGATESQNRFNLVLQGFVRAFTKPEHPLVLFLDDLQWADVASLQLLCALLTDPERGHLLVIGAYRDNEVDAAHPMMMAVAELRKSQVPIVDLTLQPLALEHVIELISDTLGDPTNGAEALAAVVHEKTYGNPFFINQFLSMLYREGLLRFDANAARWTWDAQGIQHLEATDNVVSVMVSKIRRLSQGAQRIIHLAACIGHQLDLQTLAVINERPVLETATQLWEVLQEGLLLPLGSDYRFVHEPEALSSGVLPEGLNPRYKFLHDRVQQAAYSLTPSEQRKPLHLRIGQLMLADCKGEPRDEHLFEIVTHLNIGATPLQPEEERIQLARLNLSAGQRARGSTAYTAAADYFRAGITALGQDGWKKYPALTYELHIECAECECVSGRFDHATPLFDALFANTTETLERVRVHMVRLRMYSTLGQYAESVKSGLEALALLGVEFPQDQAGQRLAFATALADIDRNLGGRRFSDLIDAPVITDPHEVMVDQLLTDLVTPTYVVAPTLSPLVMIEQVNRAVRRGHTDVSAAGYTYFGFQLSALLGRYTDAWESSQLAIALNERFNNARLAPKVYFTIGGYMHFCKPLRSAIGYFERAIQAGVASGDLLYASYGAYTLVGTRLIVGDELGTVREEAKRYQTFLQRTKDLMSSSCLALSLQFIASVDGTNAPDSMDDSTFNEAEFLQSMQAAQMVVPISWFHILKMELLYLHEDYAGAAAAAEAAEASSKDVFGSQITIQIPFYTCLILYALHDTASSAERERYAPVLAAHRARLAEWAQHCPDNYRHRHLLISAEAARVENKHAEAASFYEQAIAAAAAQNFAWDEAIANERCAHFNLRRGRLLFASAYMSEAYLGYQRIGAVAKTTILAARYPNLLPLTREPAADETQTKRPVSADLLDARTVMHAAQAIAGEIVLEKALEQVMRIVLANAGAQRGFLLLDRDGQLVVAVRMTADHVVVDVSFEEPVGARTDLAVSIVHYVAHSHEAVVVGDAGSARRFVSDPYIASGQPRSILCLALTYRGRLIGVLYLENNLANDAFTADRIELLRMLSAQAAIAVENALLYAHVQQVTEQLRASNSQLETTNQRLQVELQERARTEERRAELQEEIIRVQGARLAELSTPFIPITERIMVMPLIGSMDAQRAQQVLSTALQGAQQNRAQVVIIDITGMRDMDGGVASSLIDTASALRLLGAQAVLTGIRPEIAQTLVSLGIDMGAVVTRGTLQSGITYALGLTHGKPGRGTL